MAIIPVTASKNYNVYIGSGLLSRLGESLRQVCKGNKALIVTDDIVDKLYGDAAETSLTKAGYTVSRFVFPHGEQSKNIDVYTSLLSALAGANLTRADAVVALGGGVVGDLAGFAAATYLRGVGFVQVPTTLLAMVDSSVGGKTAVNLTTGGGHGGKNQVGAFYQPDAVICDYDTLATLPEEAFRDGCAEVIKHAVIKSAELFELLEAEFLSPALAGHPPSGRGALLENVIARNVTIKRDIVALDERDTGVRQLLNFGHTLGHAIEKLSDYSLTHGKAVAIGMVLESTGAVREKMVGMLQRYGLPCSTDIPPEQLLRAVSSDKKRAGDSIAVVVCREIGDCYLQKMPMEELYEHYRFSV